MNSAPKADQNSPFGKFQEVMRGLLKVSKADLAELLKRERAEKKKGP